MNQWRGREVMNLTEEVSKNIEGLTSDQKVRALALFVCSVEEVVDDKAKVEIAKRFNKACRAVKRGFGE